VKKSIILAASISILSGCASTQHFNASYDKNSKTSDNYDVSANLEKYLKPGFFSPEIKNDLTFYINNELVIRGPLHQDESGELQAIYRSKLVTLDCNKENFFTETKCVVHMDKKRVGKLTFDFPK
jgi:hypothetical protein